MDKRKTVAKPARDKDKKRKERKKFQAKEKVEEVELEVRGLDRDSKKDFINRLIEEMNYRILYLEDFRRKWAEKQGYIPHYWDLERDANLTICYG